MSSFFTRVHLRSDVAILCLLFAFLGGCSQKLPAPLEVENLFIYALPPGQSTAAAYLVLRNNTEKSLVLNYVHSPIAADVEVHRVIYHEGMMQMRPSKHLSIDPGKELIFQPGGYHLMLTGIETAPEVDSHFDITLEFEGGIKLTEKVSVRPIK